MSQNIQNSATATFRKLSLATAVSSCLVLAACGSGTDPQALLSNDPNSCLLYTSPSPRDQRGSRMPSSA